MPGPVHHRELLLRVARFVVHLSRIFRRCEPIFLSRNEKNRLLANRFVPAFALAVTLRSISRTLYPLRTRKAARGSIPERLSSLP
jgi:hypothetical protein